MSALTQSPAWKALEAHRDEIAGAHLRDLFAKDSGRAQRFQLEAAGVFLDYSKHAITDRTLDLLFDLARSREVERSIMAMFAGERINTTENRAALHVALRNFDADGRPAVPMTVDGHDVMPDVAAVLARMAQFCDEVHEGRWLGYTGKRITDVVNIGIGGSDLGPRMVCEALQPFADYRITPHFVSNVDGAQLTRTLQGLEPATTLFIVTSKTFTTLETIANATTARRWLVEATQDEKAVAKHFVAVSTNLDAVQKFGIQPSHAFGFWDWVGGRYSLWSSVGLSIALTLGMERFREMLAGAQAMDAHFRSASLDRNLPVVAALLGVWCVNFLGMRTHVVAPYSQTLERLPSYLQQLEMESNGKSVACDGRPVDYATAPVVWGDVGTNGQHAFFQLLHQGPERHPVDFILPVGVHHRLEDQQRMLMANCLAQAEALMCGKSADEVRVELSAKGVSGAALEAAIPHRVFPGNRPSSTILLDQLTARTLGALLALYEHKVFVQGVIWNIDSFDQWGVELGKQLAGRLVDALGAGRQAAADSSTLALLERVGRFGRSR